MHKRPDVWLSRKSNTLLTLELKLQCLSTLTEVSSDFMKMSIILDVDWLDWIGVKVVLC